MNASKKKAYILVNFGGPRSLDEIEPFLTSLLTDKEVIRTPLPSTIHKWFFSWVAKRRTKKVLPEYVSMGGCSPIYKDTEEVAELLRQDFSPLITFHRYIPATHSSFLESIENLNYDQIKVFPLFPQFSYSTTGSCATWFQKHLSQSTLKKIEWVKSYPGHPAFVKAHQSQIKNFLDSCHLKHEDTILLFSAHGLPQKFIDTGDIYQKECQISFANIMEGFNGILGRLAYQSRFGREEWIKPYTTDVCKEINSWSQGRKNVVFVPISFTSDHIETLCEVERDYMSEIRDAGLSAYRIPALTLNPDWIQAIKTILGDSSSHPNQYLLRNS
jgi:ferrochelatase